MSYYKDYDIQGTRDMCSVTSSVIHRPYMEGKAGNTHFGISA